MTSPNTTKVDLLLLGLLLDRPMHGYDLYQQIQAEGIDRWFNISAAGVYYSLRKLRDQAWVVETRQPGSGSARKSIYRLTSDGRSAFFEAMEGELASQDNTCLDYDLAIYLLNRFPWQRAIPQLEKRLDFLSAQRREVEVARDTTSDVQGESLTAAILDHKSRFLEMEEAWLAGVIDRIRLESEVTTEDRQGHGLMILNGNLADFHLPDLIHLVISGQHSGTLTVTDGAETRLLVFEEGRPAAGGYLRRGAPAVPLASCEDVMGAMCDLFCGHEGRFTFDQRVSRPEWSISLHCTAQELILRGCRQVENWEIIQQLVPAADTIFELSAPACLAGLDLTSTETQVAAAVDGVRDVASIARELDLTLFETSRSLYCLTAVGALRSADLDKIRLRRTFREIAELMCRSTLAWRATPGDRTCEEEVNRRAAAVPVELSNGHIVDQIDPQLDTDDLKELYRHFLQIQYDVISRRFGQANARDAFDQAVRQLSPELHDVARRYGFERVNKN